MKQKVKKNLSRVILLLTGFMWGCGFIGNKIVLDAGWTDSQLLFHRFLLALFVMLLFKPKHLLKADADTVQKGLFMGLFLYGGFFFQTWGLVHTTASNNALVTAFYIILTPIITYLFERVRVDLVTRIAGLVTFLGVSIIAVDFSGLTIAYGDLLTLVGTIFFALHIYFLGRFGKNKDSYQLTFFQLITFLIFSLVMMMNRSGFPDYSVSAYEINILFFVFLLAFFSSFLAFYFQTLGQKNTNPSEAAILISTEAVFAPILAILFYDEPFTWKLLVGGVFVFVGIILSELDLNLFIPKREK